MSINPSVSYVPRPLLSFIEAIITGTQLKGLDRQILEEMAKEAVWERQVAVSKDLRF